MADVASHEWAKLQKIVRKAAEEAIRKWPSMLDKDDVEQDVMLLLTESPAAARTILDAEPAAAHRMAVKLSHQEAGKQITDYDHFSGQFTYDTDMIRALLEHGVLTRDVQGFHDELVDLMDALERMAWEKSPYVDVLLKRFVGMEAPDRLDTAAHKRISRGIESLTQYMNRVNKDRARQRDSGPGSRRAISNAAAFGVTTVQNEEGSR